MRQLMRPLICSNVLALRLALVVGISFLACNTFSSKLILTSHESLTYFLYFFPTLVTWGFCFGSLSMLIFIQLSTKGTKSYPEKKTWSTHARQFPTHHSNLLTSAAIRDDLFYPWQCAALYGHPKHKTMDTIAHAYHHIVVHVSRQCDNYLVFEAPANWVDVYHNVVICILFLYPSSCYGRLGFIASLLHNALWVNYITL
jgi:hypothetical protein